MKYVSAFLVGLALLWSCSSSKSITKPGGLNPGLEEKVGQLMMVAFQPRFYNEDDPYFRKLLQRVREYHLGGVMFYRGEPYDIARCIDRLQAAAATPLLVMADVEWGVTMRINQGTNFLENMAVGATGSAEYAYEMGAITAREARAMGVHIGYAPVMDVNNNPDNIIINTRSYGENPQLVARLGSAFIRGMQDNGLYATAKHFPGHGDTATDSHLGLPTIAASPARLDSVELLPFRAAVEAGVKCMMVAHITYSAFPQTGGHPATLNSYFMRDVLRKQMGFNGLIFTDAMDMGGITENYWAGEAAVRALNAGADVILIPPQFEATWRFVVQAVKEGRIPMSRIDEAYANVMRTKKHFGLSGSHALDLVHLEKVMTTPEHAAKAAEIADAAMTLLRDERNDLPFASENLDSVLVITITDRGDADLYSARLKAEVARRVPVVRNEIIDARSTAEDLQRILALGDSVDAVIAGVFVRWGSYKGSINLDSTTAALIRQVYQIPRPMAVVSFGSPYILRSMPVVPSYLCSYGTSPLAVQAAMRAVFGEIPLRGKLPVSIPGFYEVGAGLQRSARTMALSEKPDDARFATAYAVIEKAIREKILPGAQVAIVQDGQLLASRGFGHHTYDAGSPLVDRNSIYDLASVTKVAATTISAMRLWEQKLIRLDIPVKSYLPAFSGGLKDSVTIRNLLTHSGGLHWWTDLWNKAQTREEALRHIYQLPLDFAPGDSMIYSDLGLIMLGEILQMVSGKPLDQMAGELIYQPLGMKNTMFNPPASLLNRIPPTEIGGSMNRGLIHGDVHDENAFFFGGVSAHAGLFSTADDLAILAQMLMNGGIYRHQRLMSPETIRYWTARQNITPTSTRALGWDTPAEGGSSAGDLFSPGSFGHLGFTGTSMWIDPHQKVAIILLSNRVHPTRDRGGMHGVRRAFYQAVMEALTMNHN